MTPSVERIAHKVYDPCAFDRIGGGDLRSASRRPILLRKVPTVAKPFKPTRACPIPPDAEFVDVDGRRHVRLRERGKPILYRVSKDGTKYLRPVKRWYFEYRNANGTVCRVKGFADLKATE